MKFKFCTLLFCLNVMGLMFCIFIGSPFGGHYEGETGTVKECVRSYNDEMGNRVCEFVPESNKTMYCIIITGHRLLTSGGCYYKLHKDWDDEDKLPSASL